MKLTFIRWLYEGLTLKNKTEDDKKYFKGMFCMIFGALMFSFSLFSVLTLKTFMTTSLILLFFAIITFIYGIYILDNVGVEV